MNIRPLGSSEIESLFSRLTFALLANITLDGIDRLPNGRGCCIRSHDVFGRLPDIQVDCEGDEGQILDRVSLEIAKLGAINRLRFELAAKVDNCEFVVLPSDKAIRVGIRQGSRTVSARGRDQAHAYQKLSRKVSHSWLEVA